MQATLDASALKPFTRALACLSRYGEDLAIYATPDSVSLSTTNSSKSAYSRFKYGRQFFSKYSVTSGSNEDEEVAVSGQLLTKSLLSILRHRTVEKSVERCELSIVNGGAQDADDEDQDGLESKLIVRLHCKHGVVKTHRLLLLTLTSFLAPGVSDAVNESHLTVGPRAIRDMIEHFPVPKGVRSDPQLIWNFGESEVEVKSFESSLDSKGRMQLSTELSISAEEFDLYDVYSTPTTIAFHLREFNATIAFAESMSLALEIRFTDPAAPLFIDVEGDNADTLFVISTSQVPGAPMPSQVSTNPKKREREETPRDFARIKKPMKAVQATDAVSFAQADRSARSQSTSRTAASSMPPPPVPDRSFRSQNDETFEAQMTPVPSRVREPLFLPASSQPLSQLSAADEQIIRDTGLGIEDMDADELAMMLEGEGEEVAFDTGSQVSTRPKVETEDDVDMEFEPTQSSDDQSRGFQPLFED
ncbi:Rad9-domain-containing protein [Mycena metata]|uniref:Rad9-domain-containing protein n=1 Tax=Mycena metata TaxID=1033252 RepID=A0AAD7P0K8_9AGAR|nr:Rad9-domain-containing protein [Mycena metata]